MANCKRCNSENVEVDGYGHCQNCGRLIAQGAAPDRYSNYSSDVLEIGGEGSSDSPAGDTVSFDAGD